MLQMIEILLRQVGRTEKRRIQAIGPCRLQTNVHEHPPGGFWLVLTLSSGGLTDVSLDLLAGKSRSHVIMQCDLPILIRLFGIET